MLCGADNSLERVPTLISALATEIARGARAR